MKPLAFQRWPKDKLPVGYGPFRATIDRTVDADTYLMLVDLGLSEYVYKEIRLLGASSPEKNTKAGKAAAEFVGNLMPRDTRVILHTEKDHAFDPTLTRFAASVLLESGADLASELIAAGHAQPGSFEG